MSDPFAKFGITHLSPSSLNLYCANPALWTGRYLLGWKDESGPAAFRGSAIEAGLDVFLFERKEAEAFQRAQAKFNELVQGEASEAHEEERLNIAGMLKQAIEAVKPWPLPNGRQLRVEHRIQGVEVPIIGYIDYAFPDFDLDLKTTKACPSAIKGDHGRQFSLYSAARQRPIKALYATAKKHAVYDLAREQAAMHLADLERHARAVRHLLSRANDAKDAYRFFAVERSDFRWSPQTLAMTEAL